MIFLFRWLTIPPDIATDDWDRFLANWWPVFLLVTAVAVGCILVGYYLAARRRKILVPEDAFSPYTPLRWIWASIGGGLVAALLCTWMYHSTLDTYRGILPIFAYTWMLATVLSAACAYLAIVLFAGLTPPKYRYARSRFSR